jgi:hypothetical protein
MEKATAVPGPHGWFWVRVEGYEPRFHVRFQDDGHGGVEIASLLIDAAPDRITAATLRSVPIGRIEATINGLGSLLNAAREAAQDPDPLLESLKSGQVEYEPVFQDEEVKPLRRPDRSDPEGFYGDVATRYRALVRTSAKPAVLIAEEAQVPVATARRWINEARRRGLLPAGRQGRAK